MQALVDSLIAGHNQAPAQPLSAKATNELLEDLLPNNLGCGVMESPDRPKTSEQLAQLFMSEEGKQKRFAKIALPLPESQAELTRVGWGNFPTKPITLAPPAKPIETPLSPPLLAVLSTKATTGSGEAQEGRRGSNLSHLGGGNIHGQVKKLGGKFFARWNVRHLVLKHDSLAWYKGENQAMRLAANDKSLPLSHIRTISLSSENNMAVFSLHLVDGLCIKFATLNAAQAESWRSKIATRCLVDTVTSGGATVVERMTHLIDQCGADVDADTAEGPLLKSLLMAQNWTAAELLLSRGADAALMLRIDVLKGNLTPQRVMSLLESSGRDLNQVGNDGRPDEGAWSLLHHLVVRRDVANVKHLLQRIDSPTVRLESIFGETALALALKRLPNDGDDTEAQVTIASLLLKHGADPNHIVHGDAAIHIVCKRASMTRAQQLLLECTSVDLNLCDSHGDAPLHIALKSGQLNLARQIAQDKRCNVNQRDGGGESPLVIAMRAGQQDFACALLSLGADGDKASGQRSDSILKRGGSKVMKQKIKGASLPEDLAELSEVYIPSEVLDRPVHLAAKLRMAQLSLKLVQAVDVAVTDGEGRTALHSAILHGLLHVAHAIVKRGQGLDVPDTHTGDTALHLAVRAGRVELALAMVAAGANLNVRNAAGETVLHACVRLVHRMQIRQPWGARCALHLLTTLLDAGANASLATLLVSEVPPSLRNGAASVAQASRESAGAQTPLHWAAANGHPDSLRACEALLRSQKDLIRIYDGAGLSAVATALDLGFEAVAIRLLAFVCEDDLDEAMGMNEETLLHIACRRGLAGAAKELMRMGVYASKWDALGFTPAHAAIAEGKGAVLDALALSPAEACARNELGAPLLHFAIHHCSLAAVKRLLALGADAKAVESSTRFGPMERALEVSSECVRSGLAHLLLDLLPPSRDAKEKRARARLSEALVLTKEPELPPPPLPVNPPKEIASAGRKSSKRAQEEALPFLSNTNDKAAPATSRLVAQRAVEDDAKLTAEAFLKTDAGKRVLQRKAKEISETWAEEADTLSAEAAVECAKREFINAAVKDALKEFQTVLSGRFDSEQAVGPE